MFQRNEKRLNSLVLKTKQKKAFQLALANLRNLLTINNFIRVIVRGLTSFLFNVFLKMFDMLVQSLVPSITKKVVSYSLVLGKLPFTALQIKNFQWNIALYIKSLETFLIWNSFYNNAKNTNKTKKKGLILIWQQIPENSSISIKLKIGYFSTYCQN